MRRHSMLFTVAFAAMFCFAAGCGKKTEDKKTGEGKGGGTTKPAKELFVGTWEVKIELDEAKFMADAKKKAEKNKQKVTDEDLKNQFEFVQKMAESVKMTLTMNADGTAEMQQEMVMDPKKPPQKKSEKSTWEVVSEDGKKVTLKVTATEGRKKDKPIEFKITIVDNDNFTVDEVSGEDPPPGTMTFKRK